LVCFNGLNLLKHSKLLIMKKFLMITMALCTIFLGCSEDDDTDADSGLNLAGQAGNPRFNLQFTNSDNVDLDLYVRTPNGTIIYYGNPSAQGGNLDVDCLCGGCPQGPNENIYWLSGSAPSGDFEYWVDYFGSCGNSSASSNFTLRVMRNNEVLVTRTGTLSSGQSQVWVHTQE